jgi:murein DD-endopeptidase
MPTIITRHCVIAAACAAAIVAAGSSADAAGTAPSQPAPFTFYPQAGIPWQDLYLANFVDLDPGQGTLDWSCGTQTYDGHTGEDSIIRSFREERIGVPIFAVVDGTVIDVSDGLPDEHTAETMTPVDNHVIVSSAGKRQRTVYGHFRRGVRVHVGQRVVAGQQLGYTGSSGHSSWPHLHFTSKWDFEIYEPFAGPCRPGPSDWVSQPVTPTTPYVRDFTFSARPFGARRDPPWDEAVRTGTFVAGERDVYFRVELGFFAGGPMHVTFVRPDGSVALDAEGATQLQGYRATWAWWHEHLDLDATGRWRLRLAHDGQTLVDAPFEVVGSPSEVRDRAPNAIAVALRGEDVHECVVRTSLVTEDPDYDIVRYRYRWRVDGKRVRSITSAALSDVLRRDRAKPGQVVRCDVRPSDGRLLGPQASAAVRLGQ